MALLINEVFPVPVCPITAMKTSLRGEYGGGLCSAVSVVGVAGLSGSESDSMDCSRAGICLLAGRLESVVPAMTRAALVENKLDSVVSAPVILTFTDGGLDSVFLPAAVVVWRCGRVDAEVSTLVMVASQK